MQPVDSFEGIVEFVAIAESNGFSAAARRLGVSTSHISRQLAALEQRLGAVLLARTTRKVGLTEAGIDYYRRCRELLDGLSEANESLNQQQAKLQGTLRVSAAGEFAERFIVPRLIELAEQTPDLSIDIDFNSRAVDFVEEGIDFAIRYGRPDDSGLVARKLVSRRLVAAASGDYLRQHGQPKHPDELREHSCLVANNNRWRFEHDGQAIEIKVAGRWRSNSVRPLLNACEAGLGICYLPRSSYGDALSSGRLVEILAPYANQDISSWIVYANRKYLPARARLAINYLLASFSDWRE